MLLQLGKSLTPASKPARGAFTGFAVISPSPSRPSYFRLLIAHRFLAGWRPANREKSDPFSSICLEAGVLYLDELFLTPALLLPVLRALVA